MMPLASATSENAGVANSACRPGKDVKLRPRMSAYNSGAREEIAVNFYLVESFGA